MLDNEKLKLLLEKIQNSKQFKSSKSNKKLLKYFFDAHIKGKEISENSIAKDIYKRSSKFDPNNDPIVRVSMYNLRKKLKEYYADEGIGDKVYVKIPKGSHYLLTFIDNKETDIVNKLNFKIISIISISILLLIIIILSVKLSSEKSHTILTSKNIPDKNVNINNSYEKNINVKSLIWSDFFLSENPKLVVIGNDYFYSNKENTNNHQQLMIRDIDINNDTDLENYMQSNSNGSLEKLDLELFSKASIYPLPYIIKLFVQNNIKYKFKSSSNLLLDDLKSYDIIFLGSLNTSGKLNKLISEHNIKINLKQSSITMDVENSNSPFTFKRESKNTYKYNDHSLFMKIPGAGENQIIIISSFNEIGIKGCIDFLADENKLEEIEHKFEEKYTKVPEYFNILFFVSGYTKIDLSTELKLLQTIDK